MFNVITRVCVLVSLIMTSFNSYAAAVEITTSNTSYTNTGTLTGTSTSLYTPPLIIGIYNTGSQNIITNATSGTINSSAGDNEQAIGIFSGDPDNLILSNNNTITNAGNITATAGTAGGGLASCP